MSIQHVVRGPGGPRITQPLVFVVALLTVPFTVVSSGAAAVGYAPILVAAVPATLAVLGMSIAVKPLLWPLRPSHSA